MDGTLHTFISKDSRIQSHLGSPSLLQTIDKGTNLKVYNSSRLVGRTDSGVSQALRSHLMLLEKSATLLSIEGIDKNGADDVEDLLASHGQLFTNHALQQQQLGRLSINIC